jgi:hypothetical protein
MSSDQKTEKVAGVLFLIIFILGVTIYQVLQGDVLFSKDFLTKTSLHSNQIVLSTLVNFLSGILSIIISILLLPIIQKQSQRLAYLYISFCVLHFVGISVDNIASLSILELSQIYVESQITDLETLKITGAVFYKVHWRTHYISLLISCFPVFVLFYTLYFTRLIPRVISVFGVLAVILMLIEIVSSFLGYGISMNMMLPIAIIQLFFPIWLLIKGFNQHKTKANKD